MTSQSGERPAARSPSHPDGPARPIDEPEPLLAEGPSCPACGHRNRQHSQFCGACGAPLASYCPHCGQIVAAGVVCCDRCSPAQPPASVGKCQSCGFANDIDAERCQKCGARLLTHCAHCACLIPASVSYCPQCGFERSRQVVDRVVERFEAHEEEGVRAWPVLDVSWGLMVALIVLSVALMIYILWQI